MSWRVVVVSSAAKLDYKMDYLIVRNTNGISRVHLSEIAVLMIESTAVSLTAYLLSELARFRINVIFCDERRDPQGMYMPFYGSHDTSLKIRSQISWDPYIKGEVWAQIVRAKIKGQARVLKDNAKRQASLLDFYIEQIEHDDATNREGFAAKVYFNALFGRDFSRSEGGFINSALNYGYMVMLSAVSRAVVSNGYATQIGIHHDNVYNEFNLSCDLVEPLRPFVDAAVLELEEGVELTRRTSLS